MDKAFEKLAFVEEEDDELMVKAGDFGKLEFCVVGRVLSDQPIQFNLFRSRMALIWNPKKGVHVKEIGNDRFLFQFFHHLYVKRILDGGSWFYDSNPLVISSIKAGIYPNKSL